MTQLPLQDVRDHELPNKLITMVEQLNHKAGDVDCVLMLLCKLKPFVWGMQKAVDTRIKRDDVAPDANRLGQFFKFVPSVEEFRNNGEECEESYRTCKLF